MNELWRQMADLTECPISRYEQVVKTSDDSSSKHWRCRQNCEARSEMWLFNPLRKNRNPTKHPKIGQRESQRTVEEIQLGAAYHERKTNNKIQWTENIEVPTTTANTLIIVKRWNSIRSRKMSFSVFCKTDVEVVMTETTGVSDRWWLALHPSVVFVKSIVENLKRKIQLYSDFKCNTRLLSSMYHVGKFRCSTVLSWVMPKYKCTLPFSPFLLSLVAKSTFFIIISSLC